MYRQTWRRTLRKGSRGEDVRWAQGRLADNGFDPGPIDGIFGQRMHDAAIAFQRNRNLTPDGIIGPQTWATLAQPAGDGRTTRGLSLHIGLNVVDDVAYGMPVPPLQGCINDANDMHRVAQAQGFAGSQVLANEQATTDAIRNRISDAARQLQTGDMFLLTYSGHGSRMRDATGDEPDDNDETWVCYDRQLLDDELYALWGQFQPGVRILVLSDSCHSGSVTRDVVFAYEAFAASYHDSREVGFVLDTPTGMPMAASRDLATMTELRDSVREVMPGVLEQLYGGSRTAVQQLEVDQHVDMVLRTLQGDTRTPMLDELPVTRNLPDGVAWQDATTRRSVYADAKRQARQATPPQASVLLISGCQDNQLSLDGQRNGLFTQRLLEAWNNGQFNGMGYVDLYRQIANRMPPQQTPQMFWATPRDEAFELHRPFTP